MSISDLKRNISIESSQNSQIITVIVRESTPERAAILANTYATTFQEEILTLMNFENVNILKEVSAETDIKEINTHPIMLGLSSSLLDLS